MMLTGLVVGFVVGYAVCYRRAQAEITQMFQRLSKETAVSVCREAGWM